MGQIAPPQFDIHSTLIKTINCADTNDLRTGHGEDQPISRATFAAFPSALLYLMIARSTALL